MKLIFMKKVYHIWDLLIRRKVIKFICEKIPSPQHALCGPLHLGSNGQDVLHLQKILNSDPETQIVATGPGSPGNETTYFGNLTKQAVIRFQEEYAHDILSPAGLLYGTGYVGNLTIAKLNNILNSIVNNPTVSTTSSVSVSSQVEQNATSSNIYVPTITPSNVSISTSTPFIVGQGGSITVTGSDFKAFGNSVYSGLGVINNIPSSDGRTLTFQISNFSFFANSTSSQNYPKGYLLPVPFRVKNADGLSGNVGMFEVQF